MDAIQCDHAGSVQLRHKASARKPAVTTTQASSATQPGAWVCHRPTYTQPPTNAHTV